jgi:hypothetical protein
LVIDDDRRLYKLIVRTIYEADFVGRFLPADSEGGRILALSPSLIVVADTCLGPDPSTRLQALMSHIPAPFFVICSLRERPRMTDVGEPRLVGLDACTTLQLGAIDTVVRGDPMELIRARLRRACQLARALYPAPGLMALPGELSFDAARRRLQSADGAIQLGHIESRILAGLARARGDRVSRSDLFEIAWRDELEPNDRRLDVRILAINHKLAELSRGSVRISCMRNASYCLGRSVAPSALS